MSFHFWHKFLTTGVASQTSRPPSSQRTAAQVSWPPDAVSPR